MSGTPAPRRSSRHRGGSQTPAPQQTPGRPGRPQRSATPLPAVQNASSYAYGAQGKVALDSQVTAGGAGLSSAFEANRRSSVAPEDAIDGILAASQDIADFPAPRNTGRAARVGSEAPSTGGRQASRRETIIRERTISEEPEDDDTEDDEDDENDIEETESRVIGDRVGLAQSSAENSRPIDASYSITDVNSTVSYMAPAGAGERIVAAAVMPPATHQEVRDARPWSFTVLRESVPRWLRNTPIWMKSFFTALAIFLAILAIAGPSNQIFNAGTDLYHQISVLPQALVDSISQQVETAREAAVHGGAFDKGLYTRVEAIEKDLGGLQSANDEFQESIEYLKRILPENLIVHKNAETGGFDIPPNFWQALQGKLAAEYHLSPGQDLGDVKAPEWEAFLTHNHGLFHKIIATEAKREAQYAYTESIRTGHIVSRDMFLRLIEESKSEASSRLSTRLSTLESSLTRQMHTIASDAAVAASRRQAQPGARYLEDLILLNMARNHDLQLRSVNYFSASLGAVVVPHLTSPTYEKKQPNYLATLFTKIFGTNAHRPIMALDRWSEATDCWCAAPSVTKKGVAQIGVIMPKAIAPTSVTIEHIPAQGTFDIASAPRSFEVWVHALAVLDSAVGCQNPGEPPEKGFVCVGKGTYDVHGSNWVQNFPLVVSSEVGLVNKAVIRVMQNWGAGYTCIYRARMHGKRAEELENGAQSTEMM